MMNNINNLDALHHCTGCGLCSAICPTNAIEITLTDDGFYKPIVNNKICINCGKCIKTCYKFDNEIKKTNIDIPNIKCYSAKNKNSNELLNSSSGAVAIELMKYFISQNYYVASVAYDNEKELAITKVAKTIEELEQFRGSKYFQSFTVNALKEIIKDKSKQKYAFFGTPCQVYALSKYINSIKQSDRFIFVDIFCHGCPTMLLWKKYLEYNKNKYNISKFDNIIFRSKKYGWHEYCFEFIKNDKSIYSSKYNDAFYELFFSNDAMNESCYDCLIRSSLDYTDIRIGDYWGPKYDRDTEGVSAVLLCTEKGEKVFNNISNRFIVHQEKFSDIIRFNSFGKIHEKNVNRRNETINLIKENDIIKAQKKHRKLLSIKARTKMKIKSLLKHLPNNIYLTLKFKVHEKEIKEQ